MIDLLNTFSPGAAAIIGAVAASILWMVVVWRLVDKLRDAQWEAAELRVCKCRAKAHHEGTWPASYRYAGGGYFVADGDTTRIIFPEGNLKGGKKEATWWRRYWDERTIRREGGGKGAA